MDIPGNPKPKKVKMEGMPNLSGGFFTEDVLMLVFDDGPLVSARSEQFARLAAKLLSGTDEFYPGVRIPLARAVSLMSLGAATEQRQLREATEKIVRRPGLILP